MSIADFVNHIVEMRFRERGYMFIMQTKEVVEFSGETLQPVQILPERRRESWRTEEASETFLHRGVPAATSQSLGLVEPFLWMTREPGVSGSKPCELTGSHRQDRRSTLG